MKRLTIKKRKMKIVWLLIGCISLGVGAVGAVLPLLPSFPFLMLTLYAFTRSSQRLHDWFVKTKLYKENLESYTISRSMTKRTKMRIIITVTLLMGFGFAMMGKVPVGRVILAVVWVVHLLYFIFAIHTISREELKKELKEHEISQRKAAERTTAAGRNDHAVLPEKP